MRPAGRPSWSLGVGDDHQLELALFVRDAAGLVVAGDGVPPPLVVRPPLAEVLEGADPTAVGKDWLRWWRLLVRLHLESKRAPRGHGPDWQGWVVEHHRHREAAGSPSDEFAGLAHVPALRRACTVLSEAALEARRRWEKPSRGWLEGTDVGAIVREVATARTLDPNTLTGNVVVLPTVGSWWHLAEPGAVLASREAPTEEVLRAVLDSSV